MSSLPLFRKLTLQALGFGCVLTCCLQVTAFAQTLAQAVAAVGDAPTVTQATPQPRHPPALFTIHGSISGSQANPAAEHPIASLFDEMSEQTCLGFEFYGYLDQGVTLNPDSPRDRTNGPVLNNYRSNAYQMSGLYLVAERKIDPDCSAVQLGGRIDTLYGTDAAFGLSPASTRHGLPRRGATTTSPSVSTGTRAKTCVFVRRFAAIGRSATPTPTGQRLTTARRPANG